MRIGLDLDNTIINYDLLFHRAATEMGLIDEKVGATKGQVKTWVQSKHGNGKWTHLQGEVYGPRLSAAVPFPGALEFTRHCRAAGHSIYIISHKTQFAALDGKVDLREAAMTWLTQEGWFEGGALDRTDVEFHDSRAGKINAIKRRGCEIFVDDLSDVFLESAFPSDVTRILFDPEMAFADSKDYLRMESWAKIVQAVLIAPANARTGEGGASSIGQFAAKMLEMVQLPPARVIQPLKGGRNNKVFRVSTAKGDVLFKEYFHSAHDTRDRLAREFAFLRHLSRVGCAAAPRPLASLPADQVALMEFIHGIRPMADEVEEDHIDQAIAFFSVANQDLDDPQTRKMELASEACFTIAEHIDRTQGRLDRLDQIVLDDEVSAAAAEFVQNEVKPAWHEVQAMIKAAWPSEEARIAPLPQAERCLSPSDFGFHNSLRREDGKLVFLDFEYAGWDDPAKLIADFANQPDMLLKRTLSDRFRSAVIGASSNPAALTKRAAALEPLYQIKWACICLNDFLELGRTRLEFTQGTASDRMELKRLQLARARQMLARAVGKAS